MADILGAVTVPEMDMVALKEALAAQQQLLQKLYADLDKEREASATAASEALSMILRLQGEKAAMNMEASQYKRIAEEKIDHAEESITIFEELIYQKEMEISSLEFQIESYKYKLLSMGLTEAEFPEDIVSPRNIGSRSRDVGECSIVRRLISLPAIALKNSGNTQSVVEDERSAVPESEIIPNMVDGKEKQLYKDKSTDLGNSRGSVYGDLNWYWEQIRELDERVKEISGCNEADTNNFTSLNVESEPYSSVSHQNTSALNGPASKKVVTESSQTKVTKTVSPCSCNVLDIFEVPVPEANDNVETFPTAAKGKEKMIMEEEDDDDRPGKLDLVLKETFETSIEDKAEWVKKKLLHSNNDKPKDDMKIEPKNGADYAKLLCKPKEQTKFHSNLDIVHASTDAAEFRVELQQLTQRIKQLEGARMHTRHEIDDVKEEEKSLLKEIREQLQSIQTEVRNLRPKKSPTSDDFSLIPLTEEPTQSRISNVNESSAETKSLQKSFI